MKKYFVFLVSMILLASCGSAPPEDTDWCWTYDFRISDNGFNLVSGSWVETVGLQTVSGDLSFSYEYTEFVTPAIIYVTVKRPAGVTGTININTAGTIYGVTTAFSVDMVTNEETAFFAPETQGDAGTAINIVIDTGDQDLIVESIRVEGFGETPFPYNPCTPDAPTYTPSPTNTLENTPTPTQTFTPSPTDTPTPTYTPSPTQTTENEWTCFYDFTVSTGGFTALNVSSGTRGTYTPGVGWEASYTLEGATRNVSIDISLTVASNVSTLDSMTIVGTFDQGQKYFSVPDLSTYWGSEVFDSELSTGAFNVSTTPVVNNTNVTSYRLVLRVANNQGSNPSPFGSGVISSATFSGRGDAPCPDPLPTATPPVTNTPQPNPTNTPFSFSTSTPYNFEPTVDLTVVTGTPTITTTATSTDYPVSTPYATMTLGANTPTYSPQEIRENEAEWELLQEEQRGNNAQENLLQDILDEISNLGGGDSGNTGDGSGTSDGSGTEGEGVPGQGDYGALITDFVFGVQNLFGRVGLYFEQSISGLNSLLTAYYTAQPVAIPGLPLCMTEPLAHDICAIYYILDWTLLAPNTPGGFIVPIILAIMNVVIIFRVARYALKLLNKTEEITSVR